MKAKDLKGAKKRRLAADGDGKLGRASKAPKRPLLISPNTEQRRSLEAYYSVRQS